MPTSPVQITINGEVIETSALRSILEAVIDSGQPLIDAIGCMGQGVCGSCRVLIRRAGEREVSTALACETRVEDEAGQEQHPGDDRAVCGQPEQRRSTSPAPGPRTRCPRRSAPHSASCAGSRTRIERLFISDLWLDRCEVL